MFKWMQNEILMDAITLNLFRAYLITSILVGFITVVYFTYKHVKRHKRTRRNKRKSV